MGKYINPPNMTQESFLQNYGTEIPVSDFILGTFSEQQVQNQMFVLLVDNGSFKAALIINSDYEYKYIKQSLPGDKRPKTYYTVPIPHLEPYL
jgi:hypothetical protein